MARPRHLHLSDLHGLSRLAVDGVIGTTSLVEQLHHTIGRRRLPFGRPVTGSTRGITGLVYGSIYGIAGVVGHAGSLAFGLVPGSESRKSTPEREHLLAVVNGILGDHLDESENPLAIPMTLRRDGRPLTLCPEALAAELSQPGRRLLIAIHGLCMNDLQWSPAGSMASGNLPEKLGESLGYTELYLHYNTGRHISTNGRELAMLLERLVEQWPEPVEELVLFGHSMGGLLARSASHYGQISGHRWIRHLRKLIMLGSPHHGAPLERIGNRVDQLLSISPYSAPFNRLGRIRSAGITDLRHGNLLDEDWSRGDYFGSPEDHRSPVLQLDQVDHHVIAATRFHRADTLKSRLVGDGLVPVDSALGYHPDPSFKLRIQPEHQLVVHSTSHVGLLHDLRVEEAVRNWLN